MVLLCCFMTSTLSFSKDYRFSNFQINVIRPKYFQKSMRLELGLSIAPIVNQTFSYPIIGNSFINFYVNDFIGLVSNYGMIKTLDKTDKVILTENFGISTQSLNLQEYYDFGMSLIPIYGKYQLADGALIYFDTFIEMTAGSMGINHDYASCLEKGITREAQLKNYEAYGIAFGQKFFRTKKSVLTWKTKFVNFSYPVVDTLCTDNPEITDVSSTLNVNLEFAYSIFL